MIGVCTKCGDSFETTTEEAHAPDCMCSPCYKAHRDGLSRIEHIKRKWIGSNIGAPNSEMRDAANDIVYLLRVMDGEVKP